MNGIVSYGVYLPYWRLQRSAIGGVLGAGGGRGTRSVASFDEDTTSLGVEAARITLRNAPEGARPGIVTFSTTAPAYLDKTNATAVSSSIVSVPRCTGLGRLGLRSTKPADSWSSVAPSRLVTSRDGMMTRRPS